VIDFADHLSSPGNKGMRVTMTAENEVNVDEKPRHPDRTRDLFGVQLEVTNLLLESERRKLSVLQRDLRGALVIEAGSLKAKERQQHELILAISRIQQQYDHLEQEYRQSCIGVLRSSNTRGCGKSSRSQPAIGLRQTPKARVSPTYDSNLARRALLGYHGNR